MNTRSKRILALLSLPKYESTKGLNPEEKQLAIDATFISHKVENDSNSLESEDKTSGSEFIPSTDYEDNVSTRSPFFKRKTEFDRSISKSCSREKKKRDVLVANEKKIHILQNVLLNDDIATKFNIAETTSDKNFIVEKYFSSIELEKEKITEDSVETYEEREENETIQETENKLIDNDNECNKKKSTELSDKITKENDIEKRVSKESNSTSNGKTHQEREENETIQEKENKLIIDNDNECNNKKSTELSDKITKENDIEKRVSKESKSTSNGKSSDEFCSKIFRKQSLKNSIQIQPASKKNGKRVRDKRHICYFCSKSVIHMSRHFQTAHTKESEIQKCLAYPQKSEKRKQAFLEIIRVGDFYHNCTVLSTKQGELVLIRRPTQNEAKFVNDYDYGPCPNCLGFLLKRHIWHHLKYSCKEKVPAIEDRDARHVIAESNAIIADIHGFGFTREFNDAIISKFRMDEIGEVCRTDNLIMKFGSMQFEKYGDTQNELIRQNMRQLARLTISLRNLSNKNSGPLNDFLVPDKFDLVVQAVKDISMNEAPNESFSRPDFHTPSLALKLGYSLKKCVSIERGSALRSGNLKRNRALLSFLHLMNMEWEIRVSSNALSTLYRRKINAAQLLPITNDLVKLSNYLDSHITTAKTELIKNRSNFSWTRLATLTLARIILFNKRRSGEAAKMTMSNFISRTPWEDQNTHELKKSLTPFERKLAETLTVVEIEGKRGKKVPVIFTPPIKEAVDLLIRHRDECKIYFRNKYIFARSNQSQTHLRGHDCLKKICDEVSLENPALITGTKLRKYVATVCQVFNMTENQYDWLARHLGHDIRVHRDFYRMHESAIELTKVSRLLLAVDKGEVNKFAGKTIEDIQLQDLPNLEYEEEHDDAAEDREDEEDRIDDNEKEEIVYVSKNDINKENDEPRKGLRNKKKREDNHNKIVHVPWTSDEKKAVLKYFQINIKKGIVPGKAECEKCIKDYPELSNRDWKKIKFSVKNEITKIRKIKH